MKLPTPEEMREGVQEIEATVIDLVSMIIPWMAPIIPAYIAYHNMRSVLGFAAWLSWAGALVIEALGLAAVHTAVQFWDFNRTRRQKDAAAPVYVAASVGGFYLVLVLTVNIILDPAPTTQLIAKALLSLISVPAGVTLAIRAQHSTQALEIRNERERLREERRNRPAPRAEDNEALVARLAEVVSSIVSQETNRETIDEKETARQRMEKHWKPGMKPTELAGIAGVSKGYASKYINNGAVETYLDRNGGG